MVYTIDIDVNCFLSMAVSPVMRRSERLLETC
ncbi:hypothetical protein RLEG12_15050 [Rhizobium leguminosarum bv. trifolii CB782]|nr:hypothetical protein RLEG12_15050 [Rhizobium leguminosarum bv. trifolii CB782]